MDTPNGNNYWSMKKREYEEDREAFLKKYGPFMVHFLKKNYEKLLLYDVDKNYYSWGNTSLIRHGR